MKVLFLCTGNSCRSQIAEGWARKHNYDWLDIQSAGLEAHGKNPRAIAIMKEVGVDISSQESTILTDTMLTSTDFLVTVCSHADQNCPELPAKIQKEHWPLSDPAKATGSEEEIMAVFRASREEIKTRINDLLARLKNVHIDYPK